MKLFDHRKKFFKGLKKLGQLTAFTMIVSGGVAWNGWGNTQDRQVEENYQFQLRFEQELDKIESGNRLDEINNRIVILEKKNETIQEMIIRVAKENKLNEAIFRATIQCESGFNPNAKGKNEDGSHDRGICQFNSRWYSWVSDTQAYNPKVAIEIMGSEWAKGKAGNWTCFKQGKFRKFL